MPVVIFPGNVGDDDALARVRARLEGMPEPGQNGAPARAAATR
jgi:hypothetical protein